MIFASGFRRHCVSNVSALAGGSCWQSQVHWKAGLPYSGTPTRGWGKEGQEGQEFLFILNSFHLSYLLKGLSPAFQTVPFKKTFWGQDPRTLNYSAISRRLIY